MVERAAKPESGGGCLVERVDRAMAGHPGLGAVRFDLAKREVAFAAAAPEPGKPQRRKMKADADALPKPTGVAWAPLVALMPVPGASSAAAFEAKLAETCAGPNVKDDAPRDAAARGLGPWP